MEEIAKHNETGMKLFPTEHAKILVDNYYIMASLGALSTRYREAAIKLMEQSLDFKFPEKKEQQSFSGLSKALQEAEALAAEAESKEADYQHHLDEMEKEGYDMTEWRKPPEAVTDPAELERELEMEKGRAKMGCNRECHLCMRTNCIYRKESAKSK